METLPMPTHAKATLFMVLGVLLLIGAAIVSFHTLRFVRESVVAPGVVESLNAGGNHPQIAFTTAMGERISYAQGGLVGGWKVGDTMQVRYRADAPAASPTIDRIPAIWTFPIFLAFLGTGFFIIGLSNRLW